MNLKNDRLDFISLSYCFVTGNNKNLWNMGVTRMTKLSKSDLTKIDIALEHYIKILPEQKIDDWDNTRNKVFRMMGEIGK